MQRHGFLPITMAALAISLLGGCDLTPTSPAAPDVAPASPSSHSPIETATALYEVASLGTLSGFTTLGTDINDAGEVSGQLNPDPVDGPLHAFLWTAADGLVDIGETTGGNYIGYALNEAAVVTGSRTVDDEAVAFRWEMGAGFEDLSPLDGHSDSRGEDINDAGFVAGASYSDTETLAVLWDDGGAMQSLGTLGGDYSHAFGMNETGVVVGASDTDAGERDAFLWTEADGMTGLGLVRPDTVSRPLDVNAGGEVVGLRFVRDGSAGLVARHAFYWTESGGLVDLHVLGGFVGSSNWSTARAINDAGQVALIAQDGTDPTDPLRAYVWSRDGGFVRLPPLEEGGPATAMAINTSGQVVGASEEDGIQVAVVWTPLDVDDVLDRAEDILDDLVADGDLKPAHANGLRAKLDRIREKIEDGRTGPAIHQLEAFIEQVEAMVAAGKLTAEEGARLIEAARAMIDALS